jgi:RNA polymerase sigma-70 factor, ECF subfamily
LWRSFQRYDGRCSLRTWVYRIAHHVATSHVIRERRIFSSLVTLEELETFPDTQGPEAANRRVNLDQLSALVQRLKPVDRQVIVCYLEDMDAAPIGEITGLSPGNAAVRIDRIKNVLALVVVWILGYFVMRAREQRELKRELDELNDLEKGQQPVGRAV